MTHNGDRENRSWLLIQYLSSTVCRAAVSHAIGSAIGASAGPGGHVGAR
jgi:hypothetical protein